MGIVWTNLGKTFGILENIIFFITKILVKKNYFSCAIIILFYKKRKRNIIGSPLIYDFILNLATLTNLDKDRTFLTLKIYYTKNSTFEVIL